MDRKELTQIQRDKLYSSSRIEQAVKQIETYIDDSEYYDLFSFKQLRDIPIVNRERVENIIAKKEHCRKVHATLLMEVRGELLDLNDDIVMGKEPFEPVDSDTLDESISADQRENQEVSK